MGSAVRTEYEIDRSVSLLSRLIVRMRSGLRGRIDTTSLAYTVLRRSLVGSICIMCIITLVVVVAGKYSGRQYMLEKARRCVTGFPTFRSPDLEP